MNTEYLFVYGSLLSGFKTQAYEYMSRYFNLIGEAEVTGTMYDLGNYPVAVPEDTGRKIHGELFQIKRSIELSYALMQLDSYEGLHTEQGEEKLYRRAVTPASVNGEMIDAWIYWYNQPVENRPIIESGDLREYINNKS